MNNATYFDAVMNLVGGILSGPINGPISEFHFDNNSVAGVKEGVTLPTEKEIQAELAKLQAAYPLQELRERRTVLLAESDWTGLADTALTSEASAKWKLYRQRLRDLPSGLDTPAKVKSAKWPIKPV